MSSQEIIVWRALEDQTIRVGRLWFHSRNGKESASFEYDPNWLNNPEKFALEPALKLATGSFHTNPGINLFGAIADSAPDRWGRILMRRAHQINAKAQNITPSTLLEVDYLLAVNDEARQGALRFSRSENQDLFLASKDDMAIPPLIYLPNLLTATEHFIAHDESATELKLLLMPGSSLGGARPKASIRDTDHSLAIAKFPRADDEFNIVLWEAVALTLAKKAGITVTDWRIEIVLNKPVLIIKRFDRIQHWRIPFLSAMSMLEAKDNEQHSYLEIAYALTQFGANPTNDLEELWRRIVFSILISNTDDHLRNHGFLYDRYQGWRLSPVYDINPNPLASKPAFLTTAIDFDDNTASLETALSVAKEFRLSQTRATEIIQQVQSAVRTWREVAKQLGITQAESQRMAVAFQ